MLFVERANESGYAACLSPYGVQAQRKQVLIARKNCAVYSGPEARRAYHDQGEPYRKMREGPNQLVVQRFWMNCGKK